MSFAFPKLLPPLSDSISVSFLFGYSMLFFNSPFFCHQKYARASFFVYFQASSVSNICLSDFIFPPKNLEKYRRPKYACAVFFFLWWWISRFNFCCYLIKVIKLSVVCSLLYCVIFIFSSIKSFESSTSVFLTIILFLLNNWISIK